MESFHGSEAVLEAIDLFGIRSTAQLDQLMQQATGYLSRFFDSHLIADGGVRILFEAEAATSSRTEVEENHVATPAFSSHVDISELLRVDSSASPGARSGLGDESAGRVAPASARSFRGRSFVEMVRVQDIELRVFVHPFIMDGLDVSSDPERTPGQDRPASNSAARPTFYLVGIVDESEFQGAAIRRRPRLEPLRGRPAAVEHRVQLAPPHAERRGEVVLRQAESGQAAPDRPHRRRHHSFRGYA